MRETTIGHDFRGPAVLERKGQGIGKLDEIYRGERGREQSWAVANTGRCSSRQDDEGGASRRVSRRRRSKGGCGLSGGARIFLMFIVLLFFAVVYGFYTRPGSDINQRPHGAARVTPRGRRRSPAGSHRLRIRPKMLPTHTARSSSRMGLAS
jgi:hypothetical protein